MYTKTTVDKLEKKFFAENKKQIILSYVNLNKKNINLNFLGILRC